MANHNDSRWADVPVLTSEITYLEMLAHPNLSPVDLGGLSLHRIETPDVDEYLDIYRAVGRDYLWNYRPGQTREEIELVLRATSTTLYLLKDSDHTIGMAELDTRPETGVELVHFGLIPGLLHRGIGRKFLTNVIELVWRTSPARLWLSTCGLDHPKAIKFYESAGFLIFKRTVGEFKDWRFTGFYEMSDAPQIPLGTKRASS